MVGSGSVPNVQGKIDGGNVKPNDEIEYTIYYLNTGNVTAQKLRVCDRLDKNLVFQTQFDTANSATIGTGINLTPSTGITQYLTNSTDTDRGFLSTSSTMPGGCNVTANATTAASLSDNVVVVDVADPTNSLPGTISPGKPSNSYGYIRIQGKS